MVKAKWLLLVGVMLFCQAQAPALADESKTETIPQIPTPGLVTMVDLGADRCVPCRMMAPILKELQKEYAGRASIVFIDVWEHRDQAKRFGVRSIPTQIFFDKDGREIGRHVGFWDKRSIVAIFKKLGVPGEDGQ